MNIRDTVEKLTPASSKLFFEIVEFAKGEGGSFYEGHFKEFTSQEKGNLSDLVQKGLIEVWTDDANVSMSGGRTRSNFKVIEIPQEVRHVYF